MATTTPNYGWSVPTSTDLVKDGATAIETLGDSVDATVKALNPETTLGDIAYRSSTANTNTRLGIGSSGQVLTVAAGVPSWASPSAPTTTWTLLNTGGTALSGSAETVISGITDKNQLMILVSGASSASASANLGVRINADTGSNYNHYGSLVRPQSSTVAADFNAINNTSSSSFTIARMSNQAGSAMSGYVRLDGGTSGDLVGMWSSGSGSAAAGADQGSYSTGGFYDGSAVVTSITVFSSVGNFDAGTIYVYGA